MGHQPYDHPSVGMIHVMGDTQPSKNFSNNGEVNKV